MLLPLLDLLISFLARKFTTLAAKRGTNNIPRMPNMPIQHRGHGLVRPVQRPLRLLELRLRFVDPAVHYFEAAVMDDQAADCEPGAGAGEGTHG